MSVDHESLKRVLMNIKGAARGFKKEKLANRLKPPMPESTDDVANPLDAEPDSMTATPAALEGMPEEEKGESLGEAMVEGDESGDAEAKLAAIRRLIGSV